jgi:hypothetical protein
MTLKLNGASNMRSGNFIQALVLAGVFALQSAASSGQAIGKATSVKTQAEGINEGNTETLSGGSDLYSRESVRTGDSGLADLRFQDNTNLSVGPRSKVRLDQFVYDQSKSAGSVAVEATRGSFRFVVGSRNKAQVKSPYGVIGVRG